MGRKPATQQAEEENGDYDPSWKSENTEINQELCMFCSPCFLIHIYKTLASVLEPD